MFDQSAALAAHARQSTGRIYMHLPDGEITAPGVSIDVTDPLWAEAAVEFHMSADVIQKRRCETRGETEARLAVWRKWAAESGTEWNLWRKAAGNRLERLRKRMGVI